MDFSDASQEEQAEHRPPTLETRPRRIALGSNPRRLSFERRLRLWLACICALTAALSSMLALQLSGFYLSIVTGLTVLLATSTVASVFFRQLVRPLQTLANIVVALREEDFSLRARGGRRGDALGDLAMEVNLLAGTLQLQRAQARDAVTLAERVISEMPSPVLAFDQNATLRFHNDAAVRYLRLPSKVLSGRTAGELGLAVLMSVPDGGIFSARIAAADGRAEHFDTVPNRWAVRRSSFRLEGVPHTLLVLSDVAAALREEERSAWQRLIRVLGHEINNSLTPISSIAGSLRSRLSPGNGSTGADLYRGLGIIEDRAGSLHRFLVAYQQLSRLPIPTLRQVDLLPLLERVAQLETRIKVRVLVSDPVILSADADQLQQMLINLVRNAVDAALQRSATGTDREPKVDLSWRVTAGEVIVRVRDNGPGLANPRNLFVPFYTTKPQGSGIGLVLAQQIATAHRGMVSLVSRQDESGCDAEVYLPRA